MDDTSLVTAASTQNFVESPYNIKEEWRSSLVVMKGCIGQFLLAS